MDELRKKSEISEDVVTEEMDTNEQGVSAVDIAQNLIQTNSQPPIETVVPNDELAISGNSQEMAAEPPTDMVEHMDMRASSPTESLVSSGGQSSRDGGGRQKKRKCMTMIPGLRHGIIKEVSFTSKFQLGDFS